PHVGAGRRGLLPAHRGRRQPDGRHRLQPAEPEGEGRLSSGTAAAPTTLVREGVDPSQAPGFWRRLLRRKLAIVCIVFLLAVILTAIIAPILMPDVAAPQVADLLHPRPGPPREPRPPPPQPRPARPPPPPR